MGLWLLLPFHMSCLNMGYIQIYPSNKYPSYGHRRIGKTSSETGWICQWCWKMCHWLRVISCILEYSWAACSWKCWLLMVALFLPSILHILSTKYGVYERPAEKKWFRMHHQMFGSALRQIEQQKQRSKERTKLNSAKKLARHSHGSPLSSRMRRECDL